MPGSNRVYPTSATANTIVVTTAETVVQLSPALSVTYDGDPISMEGTITFLTGAGTTSVTVRCRRGNGITGTQVGVNEIDTIGAAVNVPIGFDFVDTPGAVAGQQYSITIQQAGATGNGAIGGCASAYTVGS